MVTEKIDDTAFAVHGPAEDRGEGKDGERAGHDDAADVREDLFKGEVREEAGVVSAHVPDAGNQDGETGH